MSMASDVQPVTRSPKGRWPFAVVVTGVVATLAWDALLLHIMIVLVRRLV